LLCEILGFNRSNLYYKSQLTDKDLKLKVEIEKLHEFHPAYGHKRVAMALEIGHNRALRVMRKFDIKPPRRKIKKFYTTQSVNQTSYTNLIRNIEAKKPSEIYVTDLTYIKYQGKFIYLGTVEDIFTKEIVASNLSVRHDSELALSIAKEALTKSTPKIFHSDQGSEFMARKVTSFIESRSVQVSVSDKGSPWQNGFKESFYSRFKDENGDLNRFEDLGELVEEIYNYINYYNKYRIHTNLKMSPYQFKLKLLETVSEKTGT
jgi:putative transposase